jgi:hypothetical protein
VSGVSRVGFAGLSWNRTCLRVSFEIPLLE